MQTGNDRVEKCWNCGKDCSAGSGRFVNRIISLDTSEERKENGCEYPEGDFLCLDCNAVFEEEIDRCSNCDVIIHEDKCWNCGFGNHKFNKEGKE